MSKHRVGPIQSDTPSGVTPYGVCGFSGQSILVIVHTESKPSFSARVAV
jgi:hypothetical protein